MTSSNGVILLMTLTVVGLAGWLLVSARIGGAGPGATVVVRCLAGHVYTTTWPMPARWNVLRLSVVRWRYCPAGDHWSLVTLVRPEDLTPAEWRMARLYHDDSVR